MPRAPREVHESATTFSTRAEQASVTNGVNRNIEEISMPAEQTAQQSDRNMHATKSVAAEANRLHTAKERFKLDTASEPPTYQGWPVPAGPGAAFGTLVDHPPEQVPADCAIVGRD